MERSFHHGPGMVAVHHGPGAFSAAVLPHQRDQLLHRCLDGCVINVVHAFGSEKCAAGLGGGLGPVGLAPGPPVRGTSRLRPDPVSHTIAERLGATALICPRGREVSPLPHESARFGAHPLSSRGRWRQRSFLLLGV